MTRFFIGLCSLLALTGCPDTSNGQPAAPITTTSEAPATNPTDGTTHEAPAADCAETLSCVADAPPVGGWLICSEEECGAEPNLNEKGWHYEIEWSANNHDLRLEIPMGSKGQIGLRPVMVSIEPDGTGQVYQSAVFDRERPVGNCVNDADIDGLELVPQESKKLQTGEDCFGKIRVWRY